MVVAGIAISGLIGVALDFFIDNLTTGFYLGLFLGPIGWVVLFLLPRGDQAESSPETASITVQSQEAGISKGAPTERYLPLDDYELEQ